MDATNPDAEARPPAATADVALHPGSPAWRRAPMTPLAVGGEPPARVLVVDDEVALCHAYERLLRAHGHVVTWASSGEAALVKLGGDDFDLLLLDLRMRGMDGLAVLKHVRLDPRTRTLPVIVCSGDHSDDAIVAAFELGADDYLHKPPRPQVFFARVDASLARKRHHDREQRVLAELERERRRADAVLASVFPGPIVQELKDTQTVRPRRHENVAVLFCDVVDFTRFCDHNQPERVVELLHLMVREFEIVAHQHHVQKIKTIGDAFMATAGLFEPSENPVLACVLAGQAMIRATEAMNVGWQVRVGVHVGPLVSGIVGHEQYLFDVWGDTVNTAARMQSAAEPGGLVVSSAAWASIRGLCEGTSQGRVAVKGKGAMEIVAVRVPTA